MGTHSKRPKKKPRRLRRLALWTILLSVFSVSGCAVPEWHPRGLPLPRHGNVYVIAHRGAHKGIPENTLPAYQKAIELGADFVEVDVRLTADGVPVSLHDAELSKVVPGAEGKVGDYLWDELRQFDLGARYGEAWRGTRIPKISEVLKLCQGRCGVYFDLKEAPIEKLLPLVRRYHMMHRVVWYSPAFRFGMFRRLHRLCPECEAMPDPIWGWMLGPTLRLLQPPVVATVYSRFSRKFAERCHRAGALVFVDDGGPSTWPDLVRWGADGIQTDDPEGLIAFLERREARFQ
ncbi:MAG: glycerophosphodiester phosphodiesterase family protein [Calditrichaeota bacterium]|nr:glycerophosphodiester phosphodiesterase family protein [Calditrichota bacterium]